MKTVNFDNYSDSYNEIMWRQHKIFGDIEYYSRYKILILKNILGTDKIKILEFGCGIGRNLKYIREYFSDSVIYAYDISEKSIAIAKKENPGVHFIIKKEDLLKKESYFDAIFIAGVYHHIAPHLRD